MLCTVTREALLARKRISDKRKKLIKSFFNDCHGLAIPSRNIVAHAVWPTGGASHVSRNSLQRSLHYSDLNDLRALTTKGALYPAELRVLTAYAAHADFAHE